MKRFLILLSIATIISCGKEQNCEEITYAEVFNAQEGIEYCFTDGNSFIIKSVNDNLCPCNTLCIDPGYVSVNVELYINGNSYTGEMSIDPNLNITLMEPTLPDEYKIGLLEQNPASSSICGGEVKPQDFNFDFLIKKK